MMTPNEVKQTSDATTAYRERSNLNIARADSTAQDGTIASFTRDNTLVVSSTTLYPVYLAPHVVYVQELEQQIEPQFLPR
jgi:hypothetical protein